jgi:lon-related putative ATP-dependent protease
MKSDGDRLGREEILSVSPEQLRWRCDPSRLPFEVTSELGECPINIIGQPRAMAALELGLAIRSDGYNIFVAGEVGTGRSTAVKQTLTATEREDHDPEDLVYVHNFKDPDLPRLLAFPAGRGRAFRKAMAEAIEQLPKSLVELFESEEHRKRRAALLEQAKATQKSKLKEFEDRVQEHGFALVQEQLGPMIRPDLMPVVADNPVDMDKLEALTDEGKFSREEFEQFKTKHSELTRELESLSKNLRNVERELREQMGNLDRSMAEPLIREAADGLREAFDAVEVREYLDQAAESFLERLHRFREIAGGDSPGVDREKVRAGLRELTLPFAVNLVVDNAETNGRPVIWETSPSYRNLFGIIERSQDRTGQWRTDHTRIKVGSLAHAIGGFLVLDALDVLVEPGVWPALKRMLRTQSLEIQSYDPLYLFAGVSLKPEPIPLDVKVILIGTKHIYRLLYALDEDFKKIFKIKADFALQTPLSDDEIVNYACFVHKKTQDESLPPFHRDAVAAVVEWGVRLAGRKEKLTTRFKEVADVIRESGYWAQQDLAERVDAEHVDRALDERRRRVDLIEDLHRERISDGTVLLDIEGEEVGQVNGLVVLDTGDHVFGQPARITAVTAMGRTGIVNIERESEMSGSIHTKGVLILAGFLRERFAQSKPLALSASLAFEQSYGPVEGDSASCAELYALLSSLSDVPIRQGIAVTGSINQKGEVQPIGGVNEKIEGYFEVCSVKGLDGNQGVLIPRRNLDDLMLRKRVVEAVRDGKFHIWAVSTAEQGIEILTGIPAGARGDDGAYAADTIFGRTDAKLEKLARGIREFGAADMGHGK